MDPGFPKEIANFDPRLQPVDVVQGKATGWEELYIFTMVPGEP